MIEAAARGVSAPAAHPVEFSRIESELARLHRSELRDSPLPSVHAWMSNVVVFCNEREAASEALRQASQPGLVCGN